MNLNKSDGCRSNLKIDTSCQNEERPSIRNFQHFEKYLKETTEKPKDVRHQKQERYDWTNTLKKLSKQSEKQKKYPLNINFWMKMFADLIYETRVLDYLLVNESFEVHLQNFCEEFVMKCSEALKSAQKLLTPLSCTTMILASYYLVLRSSMAHFSAAVDDLLNSGNRPVLAFCCFLLNEYNLEYVNLLRKPANEEMLYVKHTILQQKLLFSFSSKLDLKTFFFVIQPILPCFEFC